MIAWVAQIGGQWCKCDTYGRLCIGWYDLKSYENDVLPDGKYVSINSYDTLTVNNEDVVITGIRVTEYIKDVTSDTSIASHLYGSEGYVIEIKDNKLVTKGKCSKIATMIGERIVGMRFRPFAASITNNPAIEAGDICLITDRKGNTYKSLITTSTFQVGNKQSVGCGAKSAARNSAKQYSLYSQAIVENRKNFQKERTEREKALENLSKKISESSGLYTTVVSNDGGGNTYYLHNKINLESSDIVWKMTAEAWGVSTDGGETWNGGMTVDGDTVVRILDAVGVRANWIQTGEFKVVDVDGNEVFYVNCDTGTVRIKAQTFSVTGKSVEDITEAEINKFINGSYKADIEALKKDIDSKVETWFQPTDPSLNWTNEEEKLVHEGDLWKNSNTGDEYIYRSGNWEFMPVPDVVFDKINGKAGVYTSQPKPPYNAGDLYFTGNDILVCKSGRENGEYSESDWEKKDNYTDDSAINNLTIGGRNLARNTSSEWSSWCIPPNDCFNYGSVFCNVYPGDKKIGDVFIVSFDIDVKKFTAANGRTAVGLWLQGAVDESWDIYNPFAYYNIGPKAMAGDYTEHVTYLCKIENSNQVSASKFQIGYRCDYSDGTGKFRIRNIKVEKGNKATDWTPAPEDIESQFAETDTRLTRAETSISNNSNEISLKASTESLTELANKANQTDKALSDAQVLIQKNMDAIATLTSRDFKVEFTTITNQIAKVNGDLTAYKNEVGNWMRFDADGNLVLGATRVPGQDAYELKLKKNRISFMVNDDEGAYISNNQLYILNAVVVQNLRIGYFELVTHGIGNLGLVLR